MPDLVREVGFLERSAYVRKIGHLKSKLIDSPKIRTWCDGKEMLREHFLSLCFNAIGSNNCLNKACKGVKLVLIVVDFS